MISRRRIAVAAPYRLDLTAAVLRRLSTNVVDRIDGRGRYLRALDLPGGPVVIAAAQREPDAIDVEVHGERGDVRASAALVRRMLAVDVDLGEFYLAARKVRWLNPLVERMRGVKPPRYPSLWEACVNAIVFQQVSIHAASAILRRTIEATSDPVTHDGEPLFAFPGPERFLDAPDALLRSAGLSVNKVATLRRVAEAVCGGVLEEPALERSATSDAAERLRAIKGIGPWTAAVILLRGLGRLDLFPENDSGAARSLAAVAPGTVVDVEAALRTLGPWRGLLYYHLLLARLEARGEVSGA